MTYLYGSSSVIQASSKLVNGFMVMGYAAQYWYAILWASLTCVIVLLEHPECNASILATQTVEV